MQQVRGRVEVYIGFKWGNLTERDHLNNPGIDGRITLRWIFRKQDWGAWTGLIWLRLGKEVGTCKWRNEPSGSIKCGDFLTSSEPVSFSRRTLLQ